MADFDDIDLKTTQELAEDIRKALKEQEVDIKASKEEENDGETEVIDKSDIIVDKPKSESEDNNKDPHYEGFCFVCHRPESVTGKLIHLPNNINVCYDCMQKSYDALTSGQIDINKILKSPGMQIFNIPGIQNMNQEMPAQKKIKRHKEGEEKAALIDINHIPAPHKIKGMLDDYIIGQEHAKKAMAVAVYNHYKRVASDVSDDIEIEKSNMLMIGPTGSGKTYLVKTLANLLDVPLAVTDATSLTEAGYIGDDVESVVTKLLAAAGNDVDKAEQGIIFIDEIDKLAKKRNAHQRDVSGESVQQALLKLLEGSEIEVPVGSSSKNAMTPLTTVNTKNILFVCGGAFPELEDVIKERLTKQASIGFGADLKDKYKNDKKILEKVTTEDLRKFGMIPEFLGRLPVIFTLEGLGEDMLVKILKEPKNAILKQYQKLLALDEVKLDFDDGALSAIAKKAMEKDTGARALRAIIEEFMLDIMYEIPKDDNIGQVTITKEYIEGTGGPVIVLRGQEAAG
ncbi:MAG: ATP-dependent Clp protease ATP-binding subunit ClpX [Lachnospiraceae bacterium]|jgi:ATP-dependent Clp protease ATP-binding subunit ClpX|nr:ATP-dependent Clp protease ATP-binding subunit ClpX [Lachnospiraceae bacterium]